MSVKKIEEALELLSGLQGSAGTSKTYRAVGEAVVSARAEVAAIKQAAKDLDDNLAAQVFGSNGEKIEAALNLLQCIAEEQS